MICTPLGMWESERRMMWPACVEGDFEPATALQIGPADTVTFHVGAGHDLRRPAGPRTFAACELAGAIELVRPCTHTTSSFATAASPT